MAKAPVLTPYEQFLYDHQINLLSNLRKSIYLFFVTTMFLILFDLASHLSAANNLCNSSFFTNDSLNALMYFISRSMSCFPAQLIVLKLFWQSKNKVRLLRESRSIFSESGPTSDTMHQERSRSSEFSHRQSVQTVDPDRFSDMPSPSGGFAIVRQRTQPMKSILFNDISHESLLSDNKEYLESQIRTRLGTDVAVHAHYINPAPDEPTPNLKSS